MFGTSQQTVFGTPILSPLPAVFNFRGNSDSPVELKFGAADKVDPGIPPTNEEKKINESKQQIFSIGTVSGKISPAQKAPRGKRLGAKKSSSKITLTMKETQADEEVVKLPQTLTHLPTLKRQALSPAVAECQRAVFAAFLWQEGLVDDAIASASHLMRSPSMVKLKSKQEIQNEVCEKMNFIEADNETVKADDMSSVSVEKPELVTLPPTLNHLVTFWEEISSTVVEKSNLSFSPPNVPDIAQELLKRYEEEKLEIEKRKKEKDKKMGFAGAAGAGSTKCELCSQSFSDPVTYHMKEAHPGCGRHASGWGYNSKGTFCSGWAGNCGDGGRGGSTWYLMCKSCHSKYLSMKDETKKKEVKPAPLPKMKTKKPGKPRNLPPITAVQGMTLNAKFLLEIDRISDSSLAPCVPAIDELKISGIERQLSSPFGNQVVQRADTMKSESQTVESLRPVFLRSKSVAVGRVADDEMQSVASQVVDNPLMSKPSKNLRKLMYNRSKKSNNSKESSYNRIMGFLLYYHDLDGLRTCMKQSVRVAWNKVLCHKGKCI